ncbi:DUF4145 domain-containing protein [Bacillus pumilus]|uniref:DUF4145 domain-containing protein n=1 Tax=Bacillus pumilus TaxID=1408 RepID=UPI0011A55505|nr:DUF4145 domain-containing protein [Bacillus pumilus]
MERLPGFWVANGKIMSTGFQCGYCQKSVAAIDGIYCQSRDSYKKFATIAFCPHCNFPTVLSDFLDQRQIPMPKKGAKIEGVKENIEKLYEEVRSCYSIGSFNAAVLLARKLLMIIAVDKGADEGKKFQFYVDYLSSQFIAPNNRSWVDKIRLTGNIATHEIPDINKEDAEKILLFVEMLLRLVYEFPSKSI